LNTVPPPPEIVPPLIVNVPVTVVSVIGELPIAPGIVDETLVRVMFNGDVEISNAVLLVEEIVPLVELIVPPLPLMTRASWPDVGLILRAPYVTPPLPLLDIWTPVLPEPLTVVLPKL
jgi:hypothetical protein